MTTQVHIDAIYNSFSNNTNIPDDLIKIIVYKYYDIRPLCRACMTPRDIVFETNNRFTIKCPKCIHTYMTYNIVYEKSVKKFTPTTHFLPKI
jgi:hypothetical protein